MEWGDGIDLWGLVLGTRDLIREMGLIFWDTPWGCDTGWMWAMGLSYGSVPWGRATGDGMDGVMEWICGGEPWGRMTLT